MPCPPDLNNVFPNMPTPPCDCPCEDFSDNPVRYANGEIRLVEDDLQAAGFGNFWSHVRTWGNQMSNAYDGPNGFNWFSRDLPYLAQFEGAESAYVVMGDANNALWFDPAPNGGFLARFGQKTTLAIDPATSNFLLTGLDGSVTEFNGVSSAHPLLFKKYTDPAGNVTAVTAYSDGEINTIERTCVVNSVPTKQLLTYDFDETFSRLTTLTLQSGPSAGPLANVFQVRYTYTGDDLDDNDGNLETVQQFSWQNGQWQSLGTTYYRYDDGHALKFVVRPQGYSDLV
ncbi:MAG TPA: hypothetical protein VGH74_08560, partial [Planctomycetaceae bacterium]